MRVPYKLKIQGENNIYKCTSLNFIIEISMNRINKRLKYVCQYQYEDIDLWIGQYNIDIID